MKDRARPQQLALVVGAAILVAGCARGDRTSARPASGTTTGAEIAGRNTAAAPEPLFENLGSYHRAITTASPDAARYFDQGLRLTYAFNHDEARRSFQAGERLDPRCAILFWGEALTLGTNYNRPASAERTKEAYGITQRAVALLPNASPVERALVLALTKRYSDPPPKGAAGQAALDLAYAEAMRAVALRFPDDADVQTLFAESMMDLRPWDLWSKDGTPQPKTTEIVLTLEGVLGKKPAHPGANHYYLHALEASPHPEYALTAAERLPSLMPGAGHLVHMPSHIYMRVGRYEDAAEANRRALRVDAEYAEVAKPIGFYAMYMAHNGLFLSAAAMMEGRRAESVEAARAALTHLPPAMLRDMPGLAFVLPLPALVLSRFGQWEDVLREPEPEEALHAARGLSHYARGRALVGLSRLEEAGQEQARLDEIERTIAPDTPADLNRAKDLLYIASAILAGERSAKQRSWNTAINTLQEAVKAYDALHYAEPADWYYPPRQSLGAVLLLAGQPALAEGVYRDDLKQHPENGWSLFGLVESLRAQQKKDQAAAVQVRFEKAWARADVTLHASDF